MICQPVFFISTCQLILEFCQLLLFLLQLLNLDSKLSFLGVKIINYAVELIVCFIKLFAELINLLSLIKQLSSDVGNFISCCLNLFLQSLDIGSLFFKVFFTGLNFSLGLGKFDPKSFKFLILFSKFVSLIIRILVRSLEGSNYFFKLGLFFSKLFAFVFSFKLRLLKGITKSFQLFFLKATQIKSGDPLEYIYNQNYR